MGPGGRCLEHGTVHAVRHPLSVIRNGALVRVNDAARGHGQIRAFSNRTYDATEAPPTLALRNDDYGRIARLLASGPVGLELEIVNHFYPEGTTAYNVFAEIPGSDRAVYHLAMRDELLPRFSPEEMPEPENREDERRPAQP